jgi:hypothetical protein
MLYNLPTYNSPSVNKSRVDPVINCPHDVHTCGIVQVGYHQLFLYFVLDGGQWSAYYPGRFSPAQNISTTQCLGGLVEPCRQFWAQWWREIFLAFIGNRPTAFLHVATHSTDGPRFPH